MNPLCLLSTAAIFGCSGAGWAQESGASPADEAYAKYREAITKPSYGLVKVEGLIRKLPTVADDDSRVMKASQWDSLSTREKFTYCMLHGEQFSQNCNDMPQIPDSRDKILAHIIDGFDDSNTWSERQEKFLTGHRRTVIGLIRSTIRTHHRVGANLKLAIQELEADELIPDLISIYKPQHKDQDILTLLLLLMKDGKYKRFLKSPMYQTLYKDDESSYRSFVMATPTNRQFVITTATRYFRTQN